MYHLERVVAVELDQGHGAVAGFLLLGVQERVEATDDVFDQSLHRTGPVDQERNVHGHVTVGFPTRVRVRNNVCGLADPVGNIDRGVQTVDLGEVARPGSGSVSGTEA